MPSGAVRADGIVTRAGVFEYLNADGTMRYELRHPDDVFDAKSLATLGGVPLTNLHPTDAEEKPVFVTPENYDKYGVGTLGDEVEIINPYVKIALNIQRKDGIEAVEQGRVELSLGYKCFVYPEEGVFDGVPYTHRQKEIEYNHCALVDEARAGHQARVLGLGLNKLNADSANIKDVGLQIIRKEPMGQNNNESKSATAELVGGVSLDGYSSLNIDGVDIPMSLAASVAVNSKIRDLQSKVDGLQTELTTAQKLVVDNNSLKSELDKVTAENAVFKAKIDTLDTDLAQARSKADELQTQLDAKNDAIDPARIMPFVQARVSLERSASFWIDDENLPNMTDREIMEAVISKQSGDRIDTKEKSDEFVKHAYETLLILNADSGVKKLRKDATDTSQHSSSQRNDGSSNPNGNEDREDAGHDVEADVKKRQQRVKAPLAGHLRDN